MLIIEVLLIMTMFLWFLSVLPLAQVAPYAWSQGVLAWIAVFLICLILFVPALGGATRLGHLGMVLSGLRTL